MREIKFRGHTGQEWVYGNLIQYQDSNGNACTQIEETKWDDFGCCDVDPKSVGQFTGLKDKNGRKIFEGDIIKYSGHYLSDTWEKESIGVVEWDEETASYPWQLTDTGFMDGPEWREVIGNTFDNPELLS